MERAARMAVDGPDDAEVRRHVVQPEDRVPVPADRSRNQEEFRDHAVLPPEDRAELVRVRILRGAQDHPEGLPSDRGRRWNRAIGSSRLRELLLDSLEEVVAEPDEPCGPLAR